MVKSGTIIEINETGTSLRYKPGLLIGGSIHHECSLSRSIGWYIEGILTLALFCKHPMKLELTGITNDSQDLSVDSLSAVTLPLLRNFGIDGVSILIKRRGAPPLGGGIVEFNCPIIRELKSLFIIDTGLVKRIRGIAFGSRISPTIINRVIDSARGVLNHLLPDVYIHADHHKGLAGGLSPGYSITLIAETTTGALLSAERAATKGAGAGEELPEIVGKECALLLLNEISQGNLKYYLIISIISYLKLGGVIDNAHQCLVLQLMVIGPEDISKVSSFKYDYHFLFI